MYSESRLMSTEDLWVESRSVFYGGRGEGLISLNLVKGLLTSLIKPNAFGRFAMKGTKLVSNS